MRTRLTSRGRRAAVGAAIVGAVLLSAGCSNAAGGTNGSGKIVAVGAENQYANVISQIGGRYVTVTGIMSNPNTDPHTFEANPRIARTISSARLIVQNGLGYDAFMDRIEQASSGSGRRVVTVQDLLRLPDSTANPHLWYQPSTMPAVAKAVAADLSAIAPAHKGYFAARLSAFDASMRSVDKAIGRLRTAGHGAAVAVTEPVADDLLQAAGLKNLTPWSFQADVMNGTDPSPQDAAAQRALFTGHKVSAFVYNQQVTDSLTSSLLALARRNGIPVVGVYETMPTGYTYQRWMKAEVAALDGAVNHHRSSPTL